MKKLFILSVLCLLAATFVSCTRELGIDVKTIHSYDSFTATIEANPATKAMISSDGKVSWVKDDNIIIFGDNADTYYFQWDGNGCFKGGNVIGSSFTAYYPDTFNLDGNRLVLRNAWPSPFEASKQTWGSIPMVAKSNNNDLCFKQTLGLIHLRITSSAANHGCNCITIKGNNDEILSGEGFIDLSSEVPVYKVFTENANTSTSLTYASAEPFDLTNGFDVFFPLPEIVLENGFTVSFEVKNINTWATEREAKKSTANRVEIKRGKMLSYTVDVAGMFEADNNQKEKERQALIDLYNALDGPNWINNANWCTDMPLNTWFGVGADNDGHVVSLDIHNNRLSGTIPDSFSNLQHLKSIWMEENEGVVRGFEKAFLLNDLRYIILGNSLYFDRYDENLFFEIPPEIGNLKNLGLLSLYGVKGAIPEELYNLESLESLTIRSCSVTAPLSHSIGRLSKLKELDLIGNEDRNAFVGPIPDELYDLTDLESLEIQYTGLNGSLSPRIGALTKLGYLSIAANNLSGSIPAELSSLPDDMELMLGENSLSGPVPQEFAGWRPWDRCWAYVLNGNNLDYTSARPHVIPFDVITTSGSHYTSDMVRNNEMTVLYSWDSTNCPSSIIYMPTLKSLYNTYHSEGFDCLGWSLWEDTQTIKNFVINEGLPWPNFKADDNNGFLDAPFIYPDHKSTSITAFNKNGELVFTEIVQNREDFEGFVRQWFGEGPENLYESTDYSADGTVHVLQTATEGAGIDIVLMGDAYSDRLIADGTYATVMSSAMEAFFAEEPYKTYRNCFNVSYVDVVSKNESHNGDTALSTWYGDGTSVGGDDDKVFEYAGKVLTPVGKSVDDALVLVMMNRDYYAGTCYMYGIDGGDFGRGKAVAYMPVSSVSDVFGQVLRHEAGGHGFAKLADEYSYQEMGAIPQEKLDEYHSMESYGWWRNVDFTSDPAAVKWSSFIADNRYASEGIGVYEGACTYAFGAFRPTQNSIMNDNTGGFNAPSRYAIWYRINKLAYGAEWTGTYEDFVTWDLAHRNAAPARRGSKSRAPEKPLPPLAPPVVIWR